MTVTVNHYKTTNLALCAYLEMNGLRFRFVQVESEEDSRGNARAVFVFEDAQGIGQDLAIDFRFSNEKKYRDLTFFYRGEIEKVAKGKDGIKS